MEKDPRALIYTARSLSAVAIVGDSVVIQVDCPDLGMSPDVKLYFRMDSAEARALASSLIRKADEAEATQHPRQ